MYSRYNAINMLKLFNSLTRKIEEFKPINPSFVHMYTCGPTVYDFAHIGNFRAYSTADILVRVLRFNGYDVKFVMNITDVGHMTNDQTGGADTGEDKIEKTAKKQGKSVWDVARFYTEAFLKDYRALNLTPQNVLARATDHIKEQIGLIKRLEKNGLIYRTSDGIYFDTSKFFGYGQMSSLDQLKEGARVEANPEKRNPRDFALWKFSYLKGRSFDEALPLSSRRAHGLKPFRQDGSVSRRQMEWESPWGVGFPGWHIECSAMGMKYLGEQMDIHTGGVDHKEIHHPNEIAQSEGATGKKFVTYWVHTAFMRVEGQKMSKSLGNIYTLADLEKRGYEPMMLRYLYLQTHYRQEMNFTFPALDAAASAFKKLLREVSTWDKPEIGCAEFEAKFLEAINDDLNMPKALAVVWELVKSDYPTKAKAASLFRMDQVLGLDLEKGSARLLKEKQVVPDEVKKLLRERESMRMARKFGEADEVRKKIEELGYEVEDTEKGVKVRKN